MSTSESPANKCPRCGAEILPDARDKVCPRCALADALGGSPEDHDTQFLSLTDIPLPAGQNAAPEAGDAVNSDKPGSSFHTRRDKPGDRIGRYKILEEIGEGGCGVVYVAEQEQPVRRRVALKVIKLGMDTRQVIARFEAERQALALMDHSNIAKVLDAGATETGRPYFVMELVKGVRITDYCDRNSLSTTERLGLFIRVCQAIQHAHQKGIIHRDIKPSNILVTLHDGVPVPKVIDFGIAKATSNQRLTDKTVYTAIEQFIGTPAYMSPEQAELSGLDIDTRSDIYALGVLLYELLTGQTPFDAKRLVEAGLDEIRRIIREEDPPRPSMRISVLTNVEQTTIAKHRHSEPPKLLGIIRGDLDWIVMKTLEKDRTRRYESSSGLAADIQRYLSSEPVLARPPSRLYRWEKAFRRNRLAFSAAAAVVAVLVLGIAASTWSEIRASHAECELAKKENAEAKVQAENARKEKVWADEQARIAVETVEQLQIQKAEDLFKADRTPLALAHLANVLRQNPSNSIAAGRIMSALAQRNFIMPRFPSLGPLRLAEFSPDGRRLAKVDADHRLEILDVYSGLTIAGPMVVSNAVLAIKYSPDGKELLTFSDNRFRLWNAANLTILEESEPYSIPINSFEFTSHGPRAISIENRTAVSILEALDGKVLVGPLEHKEQNALPVEHAILSQDGESLLVASEYSWLGIWDARHGIPLSESLTETFTEMKDGSTFGNGSFGSVDDYIFDAKIKLPRTFVLDASIDCRCVAFSPDGQGYAYALPDSTVLSLTPDTGILVCDSAWHHGAIQSLRFSSSGKNLLTSWSDGTARLWNATNGQPLTEAIRFKPGEITMSPDDSSVLVESAAGAAIWDLRPTEQRPIQVWDSNLRSEDKISLDGQLSASIGSSNVVIFDRRSGRPLTKGLQYEGSVKSVEFSHDSQWLVLAINGDDTLGVSETSVQVVNSRTGKNLMPSILHQKGVTHAEFSSNGEWIATASSDTTARIWNAQTGKPVTETMQCGGKVQWVKFSPDGSLLLTIADETTARVWDTRNGTSRFELHHEGLVKYGEFSPNGRFLVTVAEDRSARIWEVSSGRMLNCLRHDATVNTAAFSPDGSVLATGCADNTLWIWNSMTGHPLTGPLSLRTQADKYKSNLDSVQFVNAGKQVKTKVGDAQFLWDVPRMLGPAPSWLTDLAEAVAGQRLAEGGRIENVPPESISDLQIRLRATTEDNTDDPYLNWATWFFGNRAERLVSPFTKLSVPKYIDQCIQAGTQDSLEVAEQLSFGQIEVAIRIWEARVLMRKFQQVEVLIDKGDWTAADALCREVLADLNRLSLGNSPKAKTTINNLGYALIRQGRYSDLTPLLIVGLEPDTLVEKIANDLRRPANLGSSLNQADFEIAVDELLKLVSAGNSKMANLLRLRGDARAQRGQFGGAATDLARFIQMDPADHWDWYQLAPLLAQSGDTESYRKHCQAMLARFGATENPSVAERMAKASLLFPSVQSDLTTPSSLADRAVNLGKDHVWLAYFQFTKGLAEYRASSFTNAAAWAQKALDNKGVYARDVQAYLILAMANQQLGQTNEASTFLAKAKEVVETKLPKLDSGNLGDSWHDVLIAHILLREAEGLIERGVTVEKKK